MNDINAPCHGGLTSRRTFEGTGDDDASATVIATSQQPPRKRQRTQALTPPATTTTASKRTIRFDESRNTHHYHPLSSLIQCKEDCSDQWFSNDDYTAFKQAAAHSLTESVRFEILDSRSNPHSSFSHVVRDAYKACCRSSSLCFLSSTASSSCQQEGEEEEEEKKEQESSDEGEQGALLPRLGQIKPQELTVEMLLKAATDSMQNRTKNAITYATEEARWRQRDEYSGLERVLIPHIGRDRSERRRQLVHVVCRVQQLEPNLSEDVLRYLCEQFSHPSCLFAQFLAQAHQF